MKVHARRRVGVSDQQSEERRHSIESCTRASKIPTPSSSSSAHANVSAESPPLIRSASICGCTFNSFHYSPTVGCMRKLWRVGNTRQARGTAALSPQWRVPCALCRRSAGSRSPCGHELARASVRSSIAMTRSAISGRWLVWRRSEPSPGISASGRLTCRAASQPGTGRSSSSTAANSSSTPSRSG